jgi:dienelactone hydrolase
MKTRAIRVKLRDGEMGAYLATPDRTPAGAIIAIMEIWPNGTQPDSVERTYPQEISEL